jgi:hypothetical protein
MVECGGWLGYDKRGALGEKLLFLFGTADAPLVRFTTRPHLFWG